jgi:hypothetical protein
MARAKVKEPKVQRGVSLSYPLYAAIAEDAEFHGVTFNQTVEAILAKAFLRDRDSHDVQNSARLMKDDKPVEIPA